MRHARSAAVDEYVAARLAGTRFSIARLFLLLSKTAQAVVGRQTAMMFSHARMCLYPQWFRSAILTMRWLSLPRTSALIGCQTRRYSKIAK